MQTLFTPLMRALGQLDDRVFLGVLLRSLLWSAAVFVALHLAVVWAVHRLLDWHGPLAWVGDILGSVGATVLGLWLFLPLAAVIGTLYFDRIASAVEHRFYPFLPPPAGASLVAQLWDGVALGLRILLLEVLALVCALLLPGIGLLLGWFIAAYAIGRGVFVAVAMRRMPRSHAEMLYRSVRPAVLLQGAAMALAGSIPLLNLLVPVIGTAAMVHVLDRAVTSRPAG
jgi:CysZ protein